MNVSSVSQRMGTILLVRALPTIVSALVITFSRNHAAIVGQAVFVGFALALAGILLASVAYVAFEPAVRTAVGVQAIATAISGAIAAATIGQGLTVLVLIISIWAGVSALSEVYAGYRCTDKVLSKELLTMGAFTAVLAIVVAAIPMNDVYVVGIFGAYAAILGIFQVIAGISLRSDSRNNTKVQS